MNMPTNPIHLDCTLRDGGYYNAWDFDETLINDYLKAMAAISVDFVEIGFRFFESGLFRGPCAYTRDSFIKRLSIPENLQLAVMINAKDVLNYENGQEEGLQQLFNPSSDSRVGLVRIACHYQELLKIAPVVRWLKNQGYKVALNLMQISDRSFEELSKACQLANKLEIESFYIADSTGSLTKESLSEILIKLTEECSKPLGIHAHDNLGLALSNTMQALEQGVSWLDSTVMGMGRGPGNSKTEYLALQLEALKEHKINMAPLLSVIRKYFNPLQQQYQWGTNVFYYLAGQNGIHPSYIQEMLSDERYNDEDIVSVIEHLKKVGGTKFNLQELEQGRHFFSSQFSKGCWQPKDLIENKEVLIIGPGPGSTHYKKAIEAYVDTHKPIVIALNTHKSINESLIDLRAASHPVRLLADFEEHLKLSQPLITPMASLPEELKLALSEKEVHDFGLNIATEQYDFTTTSCTLPSSLVIAYALSVAISGKASQISLSGFDGYPAGDIRNLEVEKLFKAFSDKVPSLKIFSITPTRYPLKLQSVYAML
jgi:4-hydroxy 2-oxovalerate aldolase